MLKKATFSSPPEKRLCLQNILDRGADWCERERSKSLILLDDRLSVREISKIVGIDFRLVGLTRMDWLKRGFESLVGAPRSGAPKKMADEQLGKILEAAKQ